MQYIRDLQHNMKHTIYAYQFVLSGYVAASLWLIDVSIAISAYWFHCKDMKLGFDGKSAGFYSSRGDVPLYFNDDVDYWKKLYSLIAILKFLFIRVFSE